MTPVCSRERRGRHTALLAVIVGLYAVAMVAPASAGVLAYRVGDGSPDPAFVKLGPFTTVERVVPDGAHGVYLIGSISVAGSQRKMVHLLADGGVDPAFRPVLHGGRVVAAARYGSRIVIVGTFTAVGAHARAGIAVLAARSGRPLAWQPVVPGRGRAHPANWGDVAVSGSTLVVSTLQGIYGWRAGASAPAWKMGVALDASMAPRIAAWRGAIMVLDPDARSEAPTLSRLAPGDGRRSDTGFDATGAYALSTVNGRLVELVRGGPIVAVDDEATSRSLARCEQAASRAGFVVGLAGDAGTLYAAQAILNGRSPGMRDVTAPDVTACRLDGLATAFAPPPLANGPNDPIAHAVALVGTHVLVFTQRL